MKAGGYNSANSGYLLKAELTGLANSPISGYLILTLIFIKQN